jgi:Fic family protein
MIESDVLFQINSYKQKLDSLRPLSSEQLDNLKNYFDIELTYNSNAIEGNTLSYNETKIVLNEGLTIGGKTLNEHLEVINHKEAIDFIEKLSTQRDITLKDIKDIHYLILKGIDKKNAGTFRDIEVGVRKSDGSIHKFCHPIEVASEMEKFVVQMRDSEVDSVVSSALAHLRFVSIYPFSDGNGRTARLLMNLILLEGGYPITIIRREDRVEYLKAIEIFQEEGDQEVFCNFIAQKVLESFERYFEILDTKVI